MIVFLLSFHHFRLDEGSSILGIVLCLLVAGSMKDSMIRIMS